ncbi:MAG TPA: alanine racemase [Actinomycetota bacterium]|nr:alanine racemase [Actinomycetota bacterium]
MSAALDELETPALLVDLDVLEANLAEMAAVAARAGVRLRPHTKTHKSPEIAHMQVAAGAAGITCAKLGEAEVMADAGLDDLLIAYPLVGDDKLRRLAALLERARVRVTLDSVEVAEGLGRLGRELGRDVEVLVEVDTGLHRLGRPPGPPTADLVGRVARVPGVQVAGLLTHAGHAYRAATAAELRRLAEREVLDLVETAELCRRQGIDLAEISVGSTPTARIGAFVDGVTEIRPGTYALNDAAMMRLGVATEAMTAARVLATVVARPTTERFVLDAGSKCFTTDNMGTVLDWLVVAGRPDLHMDFLSEEHGVGHRDGGEELRIGDRLQVIPSHACGCVNLFDVAYGVRQGKVERELPIAGRGRVR